MKFMGDLITDPIFGKSVPLIGILPWGGVDAKMRNQLNHENVDDLIASEDPRYSMLTI